MITLYQLHWSHYVEKVRWALDYKGVEWSAVEVDPFTKHQMHHLKCQTTLDSGRKAYTVPTIYDAATGSVVGDSSKIVEYLEQTYPAPALYPQDLTERNEVARWMLWLDSTLGLASRRLAYTQIALEQPGLLAELFLPRMVVTGGAGKFKARLAGAIIAGVLTRRFRFLHNRDGSRVRTVGAMFVDRRRAIELTPLSGGRPIHRGGFDPGDAVATRGVGSVLSRESPSAAAFRVARHATAGTSPRAAGWLRSSLTRYPSTPGLGSRCSGLVAGRKSQPAKYLRGNPDAPCCKQ